MQAVCDFLTFTMTFTKWGLLLNIVGTTMIAVSFGKNLAGAYQHDKKGREVQLASFLHPKLFKWGMGIIFSGFVLQFID